MFDNNFFSSLVGISSNHSKESKTYKLLKPLFISLFKNSDFKESEEKIVSFGEFGEIIFPFFSFGNINTLDLFGIDELIIFAFYVSNKDRYKRVLDIGGNLGLHTILMAKLGWEVNVFEPDPIHLKFLRKNIDINSCNNKVNLFPNAVLDKEANLEFTRVLGNTTGSHLSGKKRNPYGKLDKFNVKTVNIKSIIKDVDFIKLDAEGAEVDILKALDNKDLANLDIMLEISSEENSQLIFDFIKSQKDIFMYSQLTNWGEVKESHHMPNNHKDGSLLITSKTDLLLTN